MKAATEFVIDQFWECPRCSSQIGMGKPGRFTAAPTCSSGHPRAEMEQVTAGRFGHAFDDDGRRSTHS